MFHHQTDEAKSSMNVNQTIYLSRDPWPSSSSYERENSPREPKWKKPIEGRLKWVHAVELTSMGSTAPDVSTTFTSLITTVRHVLFYGWNEKSWISLNSVRTKQTIENRRGRLYWMSYWRKCDEKEVGRKETNERMPRKIWNGYLKCLFSPLRSRSNVEYNGQEMKKNNIL